MDGVTDAEKKLLEAIKNNTVIWVLKVPANEYSPTTYYYHNKPFFSAEEESDEAAAAHFPNELCIFHLPSETTVESMQRFILTEGYTNQVVDPVQHEVNMEIRRQLERSKAAAKARDEVAKANLNLPERS